MHDPGNGSVIRNYTDFVNGVNQVTWLKTLYPTIAATSCPLIQHIPGTLNNTISTYKAQYDIYAACSITSNSEINFECGRDVIIEEGFEISLGGTLLIESGKTIICP